MTKQLYDIAQIHCPSCVMLLESLEEDYPAIKNVRVNLIKKQAEIDYDENSMSSDEVVSAIEEISTYKAVAHGN